MVIEVFKTNVHQVEEAKMLVKTLVEHFPKYKINFDLSDCDRILRVEGENISPQKIIELLHAGNYQCMILE